MIKEFIEGNICNEMKITAGINNGMELLEWWKTSLCATYSQLGIYEALEVKMKSKILLLFYIIRHNIK